MTTAEKIQRAPASQATYVYGVTRRGFGALGVKGVADAPVVEVAHRELAAIVGHVPSAHVRARRRDLLAHSDVLQRVFEQETVVPLRFGTVLADDDAVVGQLLAARYDTLERLLDTLAGHVELSVRAYYDEYAILREIVRDDKRVARLKAQGSGVDLGAAVAAALDARRSRDADAVLRALTPHARESSRDELRSEYEILRASFLVDRRAVDAFDAAVDALAQSRAGVAVFKYVGPLPPHSFVDLERA